MSKTELITFGVMAIYIEGDVGVHMKGAPSSIRELAEFLRNNESPEVTAAFTVPNEPNRTDLSEFNYFTGFRLTLGTEMFVDLQRENTTLLIKGSKEAIQDLARDFVNLIELPFLRAGDHSHFEYMEGDGDSNVVGKDSMLLYLIAIVE